MDSSSNLTNVLPATVLDIIFRLPLDLFKKLFGEFLCLSSIFSFDSAMTNKKQREIYFIMLINCPIFIDYLARRWVDQIKIMTWITKREVLCKNLRINTWNATNISSSVLSYFNRLKSKNSMQGLVISAFHKEKKNLNDAVCPVLIKQYCSGLGNLNKLTLIGICTRKIEIKPSNRDSFDPILQTIIQTSKKSMEKIKLIQCSISLLSLDSIANNCPNIKHLKLIQSYFNEYKDCSNSEYITTRDSVDSKLIQSYFRIRSFSCIVEKCLQLKLINLTFSKLEINTITYILNHCYNLEIFILDEVYIVNQKSTIISCFKNITRHKLKLTTLDISRNDFLDKRDVCVLFLKCPYLISFIMEQYPFDDCMARSLSENCLNMLKINISNPRKSFRYSYITDDGIILISEKCTKLKHIDISQIVGLTQRSLRALAHNCIHLEFINMNGCNVRDGSVIDILDNCLKLKVIKMDNNKDLTDAWLMNSDTKLGCLKEISFRGCRKITVKGVLSLLSRCPLYMNDFGCGLGCLSKTVVDELKSKLIKTKENLDLLLFNSD